MLLADTIIAAVHRWKTAPAAAKKTMILPTCRTEVFEDSVTEQWTMLTEVATSVQQVKGRFVLDSTASAVVHDLMDARPSQIMAALPICRLPFEDGLWVEMAFAERMAYLDNIQSRGRGVNTASDAIMPKRLGFLLEPAVCEDRHGVAVQVAWDAPVGGWPGTVRTACGAIFIDTDPEDPNQIVTEAELAAAKAEIIQNSAEAGMLKGITPTDAECRAMVLMSKRIIMPLFLPHHRPLVQHARLTGEWDKLRDGAMFDLSAEWRFALSLLIVLNSRNVISMGPTVERKFLNKQRSKKGKPPLLDHRPITLAISKVQRNRLGGQASGAAEMQAHIVRGHWKLRKSGVFWWNPHVRGATGTPPTSRTYHVTT